VIIIVMQLVFKENISKCSATNSWTNPDSS